MANVNDLILLKGANNTYWGNIKESFSSLKLGLVITWRHLKLALQGKKRKPLGLADDNYFVQSEGLFTLQYPTESMPVPDNGRYRLHNEMEDCIVCDKCAKICPVNCIEIEPIRSSEEIRKASDGSSIRLYAAKFDIDMAKCCFCGLCTTVCPTECLTMTKTYDFSEFKVENLKYQYSDLSPEQAEQKREEFDLFQAVKKRQAEIKKEDIPDTSFGEKPAAVKPKMPLVKKVVEENPATTEEKPVEEKVQSTPKPVFKPKIPVIKKVEDVAENPVTEEKPVSSAMPKPVMKPKIPVIKKAEDTAENPVMEEKPVSSAMPKPVMKPKIPALKKEEDTTAKKDEEIRPKGNPLKPIIKPKKTDE